MSDFVEIRIKFKKKIFILSKKAKKSSDKWRGVWYNGKTILIKESDSMIKVTKAAKTKQFPDEISKDLYSKYGGVNEDFFYDKLQKMKQAVKNIAVCTFKMKILEEQGLPKDCSITFTNTTQRYVDKSGFERIYGNTNAYIMQNSQKYLVSKNYPYPARLTHSIDVNDPQNPICRLFLQDRLELRKEYEIQIKCDRQIAKLYCNSLNSMPLSKNVQKFSLQEEIDNAYAELLASDEKLVIMGQLQKFLGIEYCVLTDSEDMLQKHNFSNTILDEEGRQFRSKNEMITAKCIREIGASYTLEPFYPGTNLRADFSVLRACRRLDLNTESNRIAASLRGNRVQKAAFEIQRVFIEITGKRGDEKYDKRLEEKRKLAEKYSIPLIFIDMTDYPDIFGKIQTHLEYKKLRKLLQRISCGYVKAAGQFVTPY